MEFYSVSRLRRRSVVRLQAANHCTEGETSVLQCHARPSYAASRLVEAEEQVLHPLPLPLTKPQLLGLICLNLAGCNLKALPDNIYILYNLKELRVSANNLIKLPSTIMRFRDLRILDASNNRLKSLPKEIASCRSLVELDLSYNRLRCLPESFGHGMSNLEKFLICGNSMDFLPKSICGMTSLRLLDAHSCGLMSFPSFVPCKDFLKLEVLDLGNNFLATLPDALGTLPNLRDLDLSGNRMVSLPLTFGRLSALRRLNLHRCEYLVLPPPNIADQGIQAIKEYMNAPSYIVLLKGTASWLIKDARQGFIGSTLVQHAPPSKSKLL